MNPLRAFALVALFPAAVAFGQQPDQAPPPPPPPPPPADAPPAPETPAPAPEAAPAEPAGPSVEDRLTGLEGKVEGMEESSAATNATVDALRKIKVSGYIQGRYEWHDSAIAGIDTKAGNNSRFLVRRGRLKTTYQGHMSEYMLQIDATPDGVTLKDAEASLVLDETVFPAAVPWELKLTLGQFKAPFGYEVIQSSGDREMPERTLMIRTFFPGERDRGARLSFKYDFFRLAFGIINGNVFPALAAENKNPIIGSLDSSSYKDVLGRIGADFGVIVFGASGYFGHTIASTGTAGMAATQSYTRYSRLRLGGDAQAYVDVPALGGLVLRGELIYGKEKNLDYAGAAADPCKDIKSLGWYATVVQNIGDHVGVVFRADQFDKNSSVGDSCNVATNKAGMDAFKNATTDKVTTLGGGLLGYVSGNLKASAIYEHIIEQGKTVKNDIVTLQLQAKF